MQDKFGQAGAGAAACSLDPSLSPPPVTSAFLCQATPPAGREPAQSGRQTGRELAALYLAVNPDSSTSGQLFLCGHLARWDPRAAGKQAGKGSEMAAREILPTSREAGLGRQFSGPSSDQIPIAQL